MAPADSAAAATEQRALAERLATPVHVRARYFGHGKHTGTGAIYFPPTATIHINLNMAADDPAMFVDSFEHELWHHLLPLVTSKSMLNNIWWEGFTELMAERWSSVQPPRHHALRAARAIEYPVQVAFATMLMTAAPEATLTYLYDGRHDHARLAAAVRASATVPAPVAAALAEVIAAPVAISPERLQQLRGMLKNWGWKEDDGGLIDITGYVVDGQLDATKCGTAFRYRKQLLIDLIQAITVHNLQAVRAAGGTGWTRQLDLPRHLRRNLERVLSYVDDPYHQYANR
jgi:hypothetical protein